MKFSFLKMNNQNAIDIDDDFWRDNQFGETTPEQTDDQDAYLGRYLSDKTLGVFFLFILAILIVLLGKTVYLQMIKGDYYRALAETNRIRNIPIKSSRGIIYDVNGIPLVTNTPVFDANIIPKDLPLSENERHERLTAIANALSMDIDLIHEILKPHKPTFNQPVTLKENIEYEEAVSLIISAADIPELIVETRNKRIYDHAHAFAHLIGYEGKINANELENNQDEDYLFNDRIGKTGLELYYEPILRGHYGYAQKEINVRGQEEKIISQKDPINGKNLTLTIDSEVQEKVREILQSHLDANEKARGVVVMLNPQNGEIISLVSLPDFDNNLFSQGISTEQYSELIENENRPLYNRSIKGEYPSGSTIKPVVAAAALEEDIVSEHTTFISSGGLWVRERWFFPDWAAGGHGRTNVYRAIAWSVNTYFYIVGGGYEDIPGLGVEGLTKYYGLAGLGNKTQIDLPGEASGLLPDAEWKMRVKNEEWYIGDTYHIAIGQGDILTTPLQVANYTSIFANKGHLYAPHLVQTITSNDGTQEHVTPKLIGQDMFSPEHIAIVKTAMKKTVTLGSAKTLSYLPVSSGGKTGTAQWHNEKETHAWYTGFAPYTDPEVVITVLVEEGGEGSQVAVPITYDVLNWYFGAYKS